MEKKKNTGLIILVAILSLLVVGLGGYIAYDKVLSNNNEKESGNTGTDKKDNNENKNPKTEDMEKNLYSFLAHDTNEIIGVNEDGETSKIVSGSECFYLDRNLLYWIDNTGDGTCNGEHNLYRIDIAKEASIENMNIKLDMCRTGFSVVGDNLYYFLKSDDEIVAVTKNIKTGVSTSKKVNLKTLWNVDFSSGSIAYITDTENISDLSYFYSYDFKTNKLIKFDKYNQYSYGYNNNYFYELKENRIDRVLFASQDNEYCVYDANKNQELYCIDIKKYDLSLINKGYAGSIVATLKGDNIIIMVNDSVLECSNENDCKSIYNLTEPEKTYDYKFVLYFSNKLVLGLAKKSGYLTYDYTYYDLFNNKKQIQIPYYASHTNSEVYFVK